MTIKINYFALIPAILITLGLAVFPIFNPCDTEDARACTWNASTQGNGQGNSFTDYYGLTTIYHFN